jgi:hypothetical protein
MPGRVWKIDTIRFGDRAEDRPRDGVVTGNACVIHDG